MYINRRKFIQVSGFFSVGLLLVFYLFGKSNLEVVVEEIELNVYFKISIDGYIQIIVKNLEIGQGVKMVLLMIIVEELEVEWDKIEVVQVGVD